MKAELISVIVPAYNRERYIRAALESIYAQDYRPIEVVVVDDGSTDGTASVVRSYPEVNYIYQENQGPVVARNTGLARCTGELIAFLDADDYWPASKLRIQSDYLKTHPEVGCVIGKSRNFLQEGMELPRWISEDMMTEDGGGWTLGSSLAHRWVFERIGHLNVSFPYGDDLEWCMRIREADIPLSFVSEVLLHRRVHESNISENQNALARDRVRIVKAYMDRRRGRAAKPILAPRS
jgi:glycosyltransferase involved in cell wall biosynthesis